MRKNLHNLFICQWSLHKSMDSQNLDEEKWKLRVYLQAEDASFLVTYSPKHAKKRGESRVWFRSCYFTPSNDLVRKGVCHSTLIYRTCIYTSSICIHFCFSPNHKWFHLLVLVLRRSTADSETLQETSTGPGSGWQITPWAACRGLEKPTDEIIWRSIRCRFRSWSA